jgi:glycosyltransferase involved in cell wall biosynthesis
MPFTSKFALIIYPSDMGQVVGSGGHGDYSTQIRKSIIKNYGETWGNLSLNGDRILKYHENLPQRLLNKNKHKELNILIHITDNFNPMPIWMDRLKYFYNIKTIYTIVDFQHLEFPKFFDKDELVKRDIALKEYQQSDNLIFISDAMKNYYLKKFEKKLKENQKLTTNYLGLNPSLEIMSVNEQKTLDFSELRILGGLPKRYLIFPAKFWKHKQHINLVKMIYKYREYYRNENLKVLFTNIQEEERKILDPHIRKFDLEDIILVYGFLTPNFYNLLIQKSLGVVYPSIYEGFGLPLIESQFFNKYFFGFKLPSITEISKQIKNNKVNLVEIGNFDKLQFIIKKVLKNEKPVNTDSKRILDSFNWDRHVHNLVKIYEKY